MSKMRTYTPIEKTVRRLKIWTKEKHDRIYNRWCRWCRYRMNKPERMTYKQWDAWRREQIEINRRAIT